MYRICHIFYRICHICTSCMPIHFLILLGCHGHYREIPRSLSNCTNLEVFDIGNNNIEDSYPCYLRNISRLRVLVLRSNKFHGAIGCKGPNATWPILQIVDLASNKFTGLDIELVKILTIFTSIDVSNNNLDGPIPEESEELKSLVVLNLSHNAFIGHIPQSLGNLTMLESLDLSSNKLTGEIPIATWQMVLTFLSVLNLSFNQLVGPIPLIKQFSTFSNNSYEGNKGLCGVPLKTECTSDKAPLPPATPKSKSTISTTLIGFDWQFILTGLGFGVGAAVVVAPLMFWEKGRKWHDDSIDKVLLVILPMIGLTYTGCNDFKVEAEEDIEDENTDDCEDDDDDEMEDEEFRRRCRFYRIITPERGDENRT
uniref:Leucine-rich repeat-containing N-terminal plant-type domain-containing protein n=1 Tax=Fagus sylvatica TaxID=28930 RepID=A0A2N9FYL7_FAGSY